MTTKVLIIHRCKSCPFSSMGIKETGGFFGEYYWFCKKEKEIVDGDDIPEWCPLEDYYYSNQKELKDLLDKLDSDIPV